MFDGIDMNDVANLAAGAQRQRQEALLREQNEKLDAIRSGQGNQAPKGCFSTARPVWPSRIWSGVPGEVPRDLLSAMNEPDRGGICRWDCGPGIPAIRLIIPVSTGRCPFT